MAKGEKKEKEKGPDKEKPSKGALKPATVEVFDPAYRDECVSYAISSIWKGLELHIKDKALYPRFVAHAVSYTVAQMVTIACYNHVFHLENPDKWCGDLDGAKPAADRWDIGEESKLPPIDSWARVVIPTKDGQPVCVSPACAIHDIKGHDHEREIKTLSKQKKSGSQPQRRA